MELNKVTLLGVVGIDPQTSKKDGVSTAVLQLTTKSKERDHKTNVLLKTIDWHTVVTVGKLADVVEQNVHKGDKIYVEGILRSPKANSGLEVDVLVTDLVMVGSGNEKSAENHGEE